MELLDSLTVLETHEAVSFPHREKKEMYITDRPTCCITLALSGEILYSHKGQTICSDKNHILFIPVGATYHWTCTQTGEFTVLNFTTASVLPADHICSIPVTGLTDVLQDHRELERLWVGKPPQYHTRSRMVFYRMLLHIAEAMPHGKYDPILETAIRLIQEEYGNSAFNIQNLADRLRMSQGYFRKLFKIYTGIPPVEYLKQVRINNSVQMLLHTDKTVGEIALACGYENPYHYSHTFTKVMGVSPNVYRNRMG